MIISTTYKLKKPLANLAQNGYADYPVLFSIKCEGEGIAVQNGPLHIARFAKCEDKDPVSLVLQHVPIVTRTVQLVRQTLDRIGDHHLFLQFGYDGSMYRVDETLIEYDVLDMAMIVDFEIDLGLSSVKRWSMGEEA